MNQLTISILREFSVQKSLLKPLFHLISTKANYFAAVLVLILFSSRILLGQDEAFLSGNRLHLPDYPELPVLALAIDFETSSFRDAFTYNS